VSKGKNRVSAASNEGRRGKRTHEGQLKLLSRVSMDDLERSERLPDRSTLLLLRNLVLTVVRQVERIKGRVSRGEHGGRTKSIDGSDGFWRKIDWVKESSSVLTLRREERR
jgi:hypothetical protein